MITEMLSISTIGKAPPPRTNFSPSNGKPPRASCFICCVRKNAESNGSSSGPLQLELGNQSSDEISCTWTNNASWQWKSDRVKRERRSLLDRIEQLERIKLMYTRKGCGTILAFFLYYLQDLSWSFLNEKHNTFMWKAATWTHYKRGNLIQQQQ